MTLEYAVSYEKRFCLQSLNQVCTSLQNQPPKELLEQSQSGRAT